MPPGTRRGGTESARCKLDASRVPWCTYTSPEIAHVGLYEAEAAARGHAVHTITVPLSEVDRPVLDGQTEGFLRLHLKKGTDRILGATLVAENAGDMISEITVAMAAGRGLGTIGAAIHPYPTHAEVMKKAVDTYNRTRLTPGAKGLLQWWLRPRRGTAKLSASLRGHAERLRQQQLRVVEQQHRRHDARHLAGLAG